MLTRVLCVSASLPAGGFTADNPFPRYGDYSPAASNGSPTRHFDFGSLPMRTSSPMPGTGLPVVGMGSEVEHNRRQLEMQPVQQAAQGQA